MYCAANSYWFNSSFLSIHCRWKHTSVIHHNYSTLLYISLFEPWSCIRTRLATQRRCTHIIKSPLIGVLPCAVWGCAHPLCTRGSVCHMDFKLYSLCLCKVDIDEEEEKDEWVMQNSLQSEYKRSTWTKHCSWERLESGAGLTFGCLKGACSTCDGWASRQIYTFLNHP